MGPYAYILPPETAQIYCGATGLALFRRPYRVLHCHGQANRRGRARPPQEPRPVPRLRADGPNQVWSWDITYLPTTVRGVWLYLYLVIDIWSRKVVAWDVAEREDPAIAEDLVSRACLRERISKGQRQPLAQSKALVTIDKVLASTGGGLDQSAT